MMMRVESTHMTFTHLLVFAHEIGKTDLGPWDLPHMFVRCPTPCPSFVATCGTRTERLAISSSSKRLPGTHWNPHMSHTQFFMIGGSGRLGGL